MSVLGTANLPLPQDFQFELPNAETHPNEENTTSSVRKFVGGIFVGLGLGCFIFSPIVAHSYSITPTNTNAAITALVGLLSGAILTGTGICIAESTAWNTA